MYNTVLVADDHQIIRDGLRLLFAQSSELEIVGEAADGEQAVALADQLRPDVVVMDVSMPRLSGAEATRTILGKHPHIKVVALSMHNDPYFIENMQDAGASGYVLKENAFETLLSAIQSVLGGKTCFPNA